MARYFKQFKHANNEVTVNIPVKIKPQIQSVDKAIGKVPMTKTKNFRPIRVVANIYFQEVGKPGKYVKNLGGDVKIKVKFRKKDKKKAGGKQLILAYWNRKKWVLIPIKKLVYYVTPSKGGYGIISITKWGDPPMAWGT